MWLAIAGRGALHDPRWPDAPLLEPLASLLFAAGKHVVAELITAELEQAETMMRVFAQEVRPRVVP